MESLRYLFSSVMMFFTHEFTIWGYTISFWDIFLFSAFASIASYVIYKIFD